MTELWVFLGAASQLAAHQLHRGCGAEHSDHVTTFVMRHQVKQASMRARVWSGVERQLGLGCAG